MGKQARTKPSAEIRNLKKRCGVFSTTFTLLDVDPALNITQEQADAVTSALEKRFTNWWDSWIEPELEYLSKRNF